MDRLKFYRVSEEYIDYLRNINPNGVTINDSTHINTYIGILFEIDDCEYIVPLTHKSKPNKWHQTPIIIRDANGNERNRLGTILFHNMIPVTELVYTLVDVDSLLVTDPNRYYLYQEQLYWINELSNRTSIISKSEKTYEVHKNSNHPDHDFLTNVLHCQFTTLEQGLMGYLSALS